MLDEEEFNLESFIDDNDTLSSTKLDSIDILYIMSNIYLKVYDEFKVPKTSMKIIYDSANCANYLITKKVIDSFALNTDLEGITLDGLNINRCVNSIQLESIKEAVKSNKSDVGFLFDGEGNRMKTDKKKWLFQN